MRPEILFLAHRVPYPPDRGDKMRSWHIISHLGRHAKVHLAALANDSADAAHLAGLREAMAGNLGEALVEPMPGRLAWASRAFSRGEPVSIAAFSSRRLEAFVRRLLAERPIAAIYAFSVQMAQFVPDRPRPPFVMDFVDFDSAKYAEYSKQGERARRWLYRREAARLRAFEQATAAKADIGLFVSGEEAELFRSSCAPAGADIRALPNGIDLDHYSADAGFAPLADAPAGPLLVFTGQMDYRPNVEGVAGFAETVLPLVRKARPDARFAIVGRNPVPAVLDLARREGVIVTGEVADVRPWLAAASVVVAPLEIARGVQNKVLEAMAMGRPVVASSGAFLGIDAVPGRDLVVADGAGARAEAVLALLADPDRAADMGRAARRRMEEGYGWEAQLAPLADMLGLSRRRAA